MRALSYLLFDFPHLSADHFVHPNDQLRVGGRLRHSIGEELEILRRRGKRNTLRGPDDSSPVADEQSGSIPRRHQPGHIRALFGIDHERLTRAGEEIRTGQGRLGELLFAAGAGLAGLRRAHETLQQGLDDLFKPRAQNPRINKALVELRDAQEELKQHQLPSEEWQRARPILPRRDRRVGTTPRASIRAARGEQATAEADQVGDPDRGAASTADPRSSTRWGKSSASATTSATSSARRWISSAWPNPRSTAARAAIDEIDAQLAGLDPPRVLLDAADEIEALRERLGVVEKGKEDRASGWITS